MHDGSRIGLVLHPVRDCGGAATQVAAWTTTHDVELVAGRDGRDVVTVIPDDTVGKRGARVRITMRDGTQVDHVLLAPPFIVGADQIGEIVDRLGSAIDDALA